MHYSDDVLENAPVVELLLLLWNKFGCLSEKSLRHSALYTKKGSVDYIQIKTDVILVIITIEQHPVNYIS